MKSREGSSQQFFTSMSTRSHSVGRFGRYTIISEFEPDVHLIEMKDGPTKGTRYILKKNLDEHHSSKTKAFTWEKLIDQLKDVNGVTKVLRHDDRTVLCEYVPGKTLDDFFYDRKRSGTPVTASDVKTILKGLFECVADLHSRDLVHRDLKDRNIVYDESTGKVKIIDAESIIHTSDDYIFATTLAVAPPEFMRGETITLKTKRRADRMKASDVWTAAATVLRQIAGCNLDPQIFPQGISIADIRSNPEDIASKLRLRLRKLPWDCPEDTYMWRQVYFALMWRSISKRGMSKCDCRYQDLQPVFDAIFQTNPLKRPSASDVVKMLL